MKITLVWVFVMSMALFQAQLPLPVRDQPTIQDVKEQLADCTINQASQVRYEGKLVVRIRELEKELATMKAQVSK